MLNTSKHFTHLLPLSRVCSLARFIHSFTLTNFECIRCRMNEHCVHSNNCFISQYNATAAFPFRFSALFLFIFFFSFSLVSFIWDYEKIRNEIVHSMNFSMQVERTYYDLFFLWDHVVVFLLFFFSTKLKSSHKNEHKSTPHKFRFEIHTIAKMSKCTKCMQLELPAASMPFNIIAICWH